MLMMMRLGFGASVAANTASGISSRAVIMIWVCFIGYTFFVA